MQLACMIYGQDENTIHFGCGELIGIMRVGGERDSPVTGQVYRVITALRRVVLQKGKVRSCDRELARVPDEFETEDVLVEAGRFIHLSAARVEHDDMRTALVAHRYTGPVR